MQSELNGEKENRESGENKRVLVLGIGNILLRDEGVGVRVAEELKNLDLPEDVEVIDGGTLGLSLLNFFESYEKVVIIDAVKGGKKPGTIYKFDLTEYLDNISYPFSLSSMHDIDFVYTMKQIGREFYKLPEKMIVIGIEPEEVEAGLELSDRLKKKIPEVVKLVLEEINEC
ncbi:MAG: hydrogenase maturation protease [Archaeoglobus sp.]|nr:hydrogenase maturation protease [Archaeoglobus sp.]